MRIKDITIGAKLFIGIGAILLMVVILGGLAYMQSDRLWITTSDMYNHPLQVSKATRDAKAEIISIQALMRDIVFDETLTRDDIIVISHKIDNSEKNIYTSFNIVYDRYLGDKSEIDTAYNSFRDWKPLRDFIIELKQKGDGKAMFARYQTVNVSYVSKLLGRVQVMIDYASKKGDAFYLNAQKERDALFTRLEVVVGATILLSLLIAIWLIHGIRNPLVALTLVAEQLRQKHYDVRSKYQSANEIGNLSSTLNGMADKVEMELSVKENASWITALILKENNLKSFSKVLLELLALKTGSQIAAIYFLNEEGTKFEHYDSIGLIKENCNSFLNHTKEGEFGAVLSERKIVRLTQIPVDTVFIFPVVTGAFRPREIISIPILDGNKIVSIISLASLNDFTPEAVQLINEIWLSLTARVNGVLAFQKITGISDKLYKLNRDLEEKSSELVMQASELKEYNIELELQKRQLDEANQLKSAFLSNMSHELRTPLNSVIALSGVLNRRLSGTIPEDEFKYLGIIEKNGKQLLSLINDILDLSRIEAGKEEVSYSSFSINDLVQDLIGSLEPISQEKGIALINNIDPDISAIICDSSKCHHILQNIIGNAVKFTNIGTVEISATIIKEQIHITVKDTGIGISPENTPFIFDEFRQADGRASRIYGGTGLGLAIANKYCIMLNGNVKVESQLGVGSAFTITLPVTPALYQVNEPGKTIFNKSVQKTAFDQKNGKGKNILLVEDNEVIIIQMKEILLEEEYNIHLARNGKEALEILKIFTPDAIILDLMMPEVDGFEVLGAIRKVKETSEIPVLILSAKHVTKEELSFLHGNHISQLIQKGDINRNQLMGQIRNMLISKGTASIEKITLDPNLVSTSRKARILVIEDNRDNMETMKAMLGKNHEVLEAYTGLEGLEKAKTFLPDLILTDISLPGMDGIEILKKIKTDEELKHIPVIALTARAMKGDREELIGYGFNDYISKPVDNILLDLTINGWLNGN
jgi:signal transduction histidine kinase/CheY-like chemotaxis protein/HAMP domain-containing protein